MSSIDTDESSALAELPVLLAFNATRPVGTVRIDLTQLPKTPSWKLALGYRTKARGGIEILCFGVVPEFENRDVETKDSEPNE